MILDTGSNINLVDLSKRLIIIGECHGVSSDYEFQRQLINKYKPDIILNELLINLELRNMRDKQKYLALVKGEKDLPECYPMYPGLDTLTLLTMLEYDIPAIGIDYTPYWNNVSPDELKEIFDNEKNMGVFKKSFEIRESRMIHMIETYFNKYDKIVVVVGDTHLRTIATPELGPVSPIWNRFKNNIDSIIIRSEYKEIR